MLPRVFRPAATRETRAWRLFGASAALNRRVFLVAGALMHGDFVRLDRADDAGDGLLGAVGADADFCFHTVFLVCVFLFLS